jgi:tetratricopeptide (TPR) repeat protein
LFLPQGKPLEEALLLEARGFELSPAERVFVRHSARLVRRNRRIRSIFTGMLVVLTVGTAVGAGVAVQQSHLAGVEAETAEATTRFLVGLFQVSDPWVVSGAQGSDVSAREILEQGAARAIEELGDQPRVQANFLDAIGNVYQGLGLTQRAEPMLVRALATRRRLLGDDHPDVADTLQSLSYVAMTDGDNAETERLLREAEGIRRAEFGDDSMPVAWTLNAMSVAVANQDRLEEAIGLQTEAIRIMKLHGELKGITGVYAHNNLGYVLSSADRYYEAIDAFDDALELAIHADAVGLRSRALSNLAAAYQSIGELEIARPLHEESLALKRAWFGDGHPEIGFSLNNLASLATDQGDMDYAIALYHEAVENFAAALGEDHPNISVVRSNLASAYVKSDQYERAAELFQEVLDGVEAGGGGGTTRALSVHIGLGKSHKYLGNAELARSHYEQAVEIGTSVNPEARRTGIALAGLASLDNKEMSVTEREQLFQRGLDIVTRATGEQNMDRALVLLEFARFLDETERQERAEVLFAEAVAIEAGFLPEDNTRLVRHRVEYTERFSVSGG